MSTPGPAVSWLHARHRQAELMDDPTLDVGRHRRALRALRRINRISFAASRLWREIDRVHAVTGRPVRVLDVACGGGDVLLDVAARARRSGVSVHLHGCDVSPVALEAFGEATALAEARSDGSGRAVGVDTSRLDALADPLPDGFDIVTTNLFLHHLDRGEGVALLRRMAAAAAHSLLVQDLRRTRRGYALAWLGLHFLTASDVARVDGLRSVRAAFTLEEVRAMCAEAELSGASVRRAWPQRVVVEWRRA